MERLAKKFETARSLMPRPEVVQTGKSKVGIIAFGTSDFGVRESRDQLQATSTSWRRIICGCGRTRSRARCMSLWPSHEKVYVVEQNRDAQMLSLLKLDLDREADRKAAERAALQRTAA